MNYHIPKSNQKNQGQHLKLSHLYGYLTAVIGWYSFNFADCFHTKVTIPISKDNLTCFSIFRSKFNRTCSFAFDSDVEGWINQTMILANIGQVYVFNPSLFWKYSFLSISDRFNLGFNLGLAHWGRDKWLNFQENLFPGVQFTVCHRFGAGDKQLFEQSIRWRHNEWVGVSNTSSMIVCANVYSGADHRKHQSSSSMAFVREFHRWPVKSPHKGPVTRKMFPFDDVIMMVTWCTDAHIRHSAQMRYGV